MAGTGNLILKRGTTIPQDGQTGGTTQLLKAMPATQLVGLSHVVDSAGTLEDTLVYAYENYPNRLWIGMDSFGTSGQESGTGQGTGTGPGAGAGSMGGGAFDAQNASGAATRPIWFGAEIRADVAVLGASDTVPTILQADWTNASDYVLVTQKSIKSYVDPLVAGKGNMTSFSVSADAGTTTTIINSDILALTGGVGVDTSITNDTVTFALDLAELTTEGSPAVGDFLSGVDISASNVTRNFTIGTALGVLSGDISVNTSTGSATVSATNVKAEASTDNSTFLAILDTAGATAQPVKYHAGLTYDTTTSSLTVAGDLAVNGGDVTTTQTTASLFPTAAATIKIGTTTTTVTSNSGGATAIHLGDDGAQVYIGKAGADSVLNIRGTAGGGGAASISTNTTGSASVFTTNASTVSIGTASTTMNLGGGSTSVIIAGSLTVDGTTTTLNATNLNVVDKNIQMGSVTSGFVAAAAGTVGSITGIGPWNATITGMSDTSGLVVGSTFTADISAGSIGSGGTAVVTSFPSSTSLNYTYTGGTTPINGGVTNITSGSPTDVSASGGGITLKGTSDKTLLWNSTSFGGSAGVWRSSESFSIASGKSYAVVDDILLTKTYLKLYNAGAGGGNISIKSPSSGSDIGIQFYTLPSTLGAANQVLTVSAVNSGDATLLWVDPSSLSTGAASSVTVRREIGGTTTKYPIPFLASNAQNNPTLTETGNDFSSWTETATKTGYLYSDYTSQTTGSSVSNMSSGLMYQVDESGSTTVGTLYCDYIGATLDCGTYS